MIKNLFPTQIWKSSLNIEPSIKDEILKSIEKNFQQNKSYIHPQWNCKVHTTILDHNNIDYSKLIPSFKKEYETFTKELNLKLHNYFIGNIWYNLYLNGHNQEIHDHIGDDILYSGVYFLKFCDNHPPITFYNYTNYSSFYDSRKNLKDIYSNNDINHSITTHQFSLNIKENDFIIFPAYAPHGVFVQRTDEPRITISMNFHLENNGSTNH